eukprot:353903-Pyramimonas_sp.AAC.1
MVLFFLVLLVLPMSYRSVQHSNGKGIVRGTSEVYLEGWDQSAISDRAENIFVLCQFFGHNIWQGSSTSLPA